MNLKYIINSINAAKVFDNNHENVSKSRNRLQFSPHICFQKKNKFNSAVKCVAVKRKRYACGTTANSGSSRSPVPRFIRIVEGMQARPAARNENLHKHVDGGAWWMDTCSPARWGRDQQARSCAHPEIDGRARFADAGSSFQVERYYNKPLCDIIQLQSVTALFLHPHE